MTPGYTTSLVDWQSGSDALRRVRNIVFIQEQGVPEALEWDDSDSTGTHVLAVSDDGTPVGTGRLLPDGSIGRMAVLKEWRGCGIGDAMMTCLLDEARRQGHKRVKLSAQQQAVGFYLRHQFTSREGPYVEAGIPHVAMVRIIT